MVLSPSGTVLDPPGKVLDPPGTVLDPPEMVLDPPGTVHNPPVILLLGFPACPAFHSLEMAGSDCLAEDTVLLVLTAPSVLGIA